MRKKIPLIIAAVVGCAGFCWLCRAAAIASSMAQIELSRLRSKYPALLSRCNAYRPPVGFESYLIGTWKAGVPDWEDTLIIKSDHTYRQSVHRLRNQYYPAADFEGDWQSWWLENNADGIPYLHLTDFRSCGMDPLDDCTQSKAKGVGYDVCIDRSVPMQNEGVFLVMMRAPSPLVLDLEAPLGSENTYVYDKETP